MQNAYLAKMNGLLLYTHDQAQPRTRSGPYLDTQGSKSQVEKNTSIKSSYPPAPPGAIISFFSSPSPHHLFPTSLQPNRFPSSPMSAGSFKRVQKRIYWQSSRSSSMTALSTVETDSALLRMLLRVSSARLTLWARARRAAAGVVVLAIWTGTTPPKGPARAAFWQRTRQTFSWPATVPVQVWSAGMAAFRGKSVCAPACGFDYG